MSRLRVPAAVCGLALLLLAAPPAAGADDADLLTSRVGEELRRALERGSGSGRLEVGDDGVLALRALPEVYEERGFEPLWTSDAGLLPRAGEVLGELERAEVRGLRGEDYHRESLVHFRAAAAAAAAAGGTPSAETLAAFDLLLSDAALLYAAHLAAGKTNPVSLHPEWRVRRPDFDAVAFLHNALASGEPAAAFAALLPEAPAYAALERGLRRLRRTAAAGGWPPVPDGPALEPLAQSDRVPALAARLAAAGDLTPAAARSSGEVYGPELFDAVQRFQRRHGLEPDGVVGRRTLAALQVPVEARIDQVLANLERWRWLPRDPGSRHLEVNIAGFELRAVEDGRTALAMRVIVGTSYTRTPVFSEELSYLVINPYWNVPASIARKEILPKVQADPGYLARQRMRVFTGSGPGAAEVDPATVDWEALPAADFPYLLRQEPGAGNSLGRIKFMLPNPYNVYLHDTPDRGLFARPQRSLSHGCIRVERPVELAAYLLRDDPEWTVERIRELIASGAQRTVTLEAPVPVHVVYRTAWVDEEGVLHLREDVYDRDRAVIDALRRAPPRPAR